MLENNPEKPHYLSFTKITHWVRLSGAASAVLIETGIGFPFDKYKNRNMASPVKASSLKEKILVSTIGSDHKHLSNSMKFRRCYTGIIPYGVYKTSNRGGKLFIHPFLLENLMHTAWYAQMAQQYKAENIKVAASALCGGVIGCAEVILNPIDRWKVLSQINNLSVTSCLRKMSQEGLALQYAGWQTTMVRNSLGTASLFAGKYLGYRFFGLTDHNRPTFIQSAFSSFWGSSFMIATSHLPDVAKVRIQQNPTRNLGLFRTLAHVVKNEGPGALLEGLVAKFFASGLKSIAALTLCDMIIARLSEEKDQTALAKPSFNK